MPIAANSIRPSSTATRPNYTACASGNGLLCQTDGVTPLVDASGGSIPDLSNGGTVPIGENDLETIHAVDVGGALQTTYTGAAVRP